MDHIATATYLRAVIEAQWWGQHCPEPVHSPETCQRNDQALLFDALLVCGPCSEQWGHGERGSRSATFYFRSDLLSLRLSTSYILYMYSENIHVDRYVQSPSRFNISKYNTCRTRVCVARTCSYIREDISISLSARCSTVRCVGRSSVRWLGSPEGWVAQTGQMTSWGTPSACCLVTCSLSSGSENPSWPHKGQVNDWACSGLWESPPKNKSEGV